ncbi:hypothetical protein HDU81_008284 [Chytriomyces hyalinus]|nr:hypothetical protein HDU81_008284 [Chytriomyces hyalinus]
MATAKATLALALVRSHVQLLPPQHRVLSLEACAKYAHADAYLNSLSFAILSHTGVPAATVDPMVYANDAALRLFKYKESEFIGMPSRLTARPEDRDARAGAMRGVGDSGFSVDYAGKRVAKDGTVLSNRLCCGMLLAMRELWDRRRHFVHQGAMQAFSSADHLISRGTSNEGEVAMPPLVALSLPSASMATDPTHRDNDTLNTPTRPVDHHFNRASSSLMHRLRWLITRKDFAVLVAAVFLIVLLSTLFAVYSLPRLYHNVSPAFAPLFAWLLLLSLGHLARTSFTDPGFLAKGLVPMASSSNPAGVDGFRDAGNAASPVFSRGASGSVGLPSPKLSTTRPSPEHTAQVSEEPQLPANYPFISIDQPSPMLRPVYQDALLATVHGVEVKVKYCYSCQIWRPPRASHCRSCDRCVENHDHHCPWTGTCIGKHNYRHFVNFILVTWLLATFVACSTIALIVIIARDLRTNGFTTPPEPGVPRLDPNLAALEMNPVLPILVVMTGMFAIALGFMVGYHVWLSFRNVTTHEDVKQKYRNRNMAETPTSNSDEGPRNQRHSGNPFDHGGPCKNIAWVLCRPAESSHDPLGRFEVAQTSLEEEGRLVDEDGHAGQRSRVHWSGRSGGRIAAWRRAVASPNNSSSQNPV